jgi:orotidine-5'-phosphate decarboxylase
MTLPFQKRFITLAAERSRLCVGIDPSADSLKGWGLADDAEGLRAFCERMVEVCAPLVACVKPQSAFFERHGPEGMAVLRHTVEAVQSHGALVIIDVKRGDIDSTAAAYGDAYLGPQSPFGGDAITLSAYLGFGSLAPIVERARRESAGLFVVVRSSNPDGTELQQARMPDGRSVAEHLADQIGAANAADGENELGLIGAVVGATLGREAADLVARLPNSLLLVPGVGAQGATVGDVRRDFGVHYSRVIPSLSRAIARAGPRPEDLRREVERLIAEIRGVG